MKELNSQLLSATMPREPIEALCLPFAIRVLSALEDMHEAGKLFDAIDGTGREPFSPLGQIYWYQLVSQIPTLGATNENHCEEIVEKMAIAREFLESFMEPESETVAQQVNGMSIVRRNEIAYKALIAQKLKSGANLSKSVARDIGNEAKEVGVPTEEHRQFIEIVFDDIYRQVFSKKK